jgi:hypothetical protein
MREIGSPGRLFVFIYATSVLGVVLLMDRLGFSANAIIALACFLVVTGLAIMLWRFLAEISN